MRRLERFQVDDLMIIIVCTAQCDDYVRSLDTTRCTSWSNREVGNFSGLRARLIDRIASASHGIVFGRDAERVLGVDSLLL